MNAPSLDDRIFEEVITRSNLRNSPIPDDRDIARTFIDFQHSIPPVYADIINGAFSLGHDTWDVRRIAEGVSRLCHTTRMAGNIVRLNHDYITSRNVGLYVFKAVLAIVHDDVEEFLREDLRGVPPEEHARRRRAAIKHAEDGLLSIIDMAAHKHGKGDIDALFCGIPVERVIKLFHNPMAPGFKAKGLGPRSYVSVMNLICEYDSNDDASLIAALLRDDTKLFDRIDDITHLFPASLGFQAAVENSKLERLTHKLRTGQLSPKDLDAMYHELKHSGRMIYVNNEIVELKEISSAKRTEAAWKVNFAYNPSAQLLDETCRHDHPVVRSLRRPLARTLPILLSELGTASERLSLFLVNYHRINHRGRTEADGTPLPENSAELYDRLDELAEEYSQTPAFYELQAEPGLRGVEMFHGSTAHMARIEMKDPVRKRHFERDYMDHLLRNVIVGKIADKFLPSAVQYARRLSAGNDTKKTGLVYFANPQQELTELIEQ